jgi:hypothetical protein
MKKNIALGILLALVLALGGVAAGLSKVQAEGSKEKSSSKDKKKPTKTKTSTPTKSNTPTKTYTPTKTSTPTKSFTPTKTATLSKTPTLTRTPTSTPMPTATPKPRVELPPLYIAQVKGEAYLVHKGDKKKAEAPAKVEADDQILTGKDGQVFLQFKDGGTMEIGPSSDMKIKDLDIKADTFKARFAMAFGKLKTVIHKLTSANATFEVEAGGVVTGIRGTTFEVDYDKDKNAHTTKTYEGTVVDRVNGKDQVVNKGFTLAIGGGGAPVLSALGAGDVADFVTFLDASDKLDAVKNILLKKLEERLINEALHGIFGGKKAKVGGFSIGF